MKLRLTLLLLAWLTLLAPSRAADTLVVAGEQYHAALAPWLEHRRAQGRTPIVMSPPRDARQLAELVRDQAAEGGLRYVLLVGDAPARGPASNDPLMSVPIGYVPAVVSLPWSGEDQIATDNLFADLDGDNSPELAIGRIPCRNPQQLLSYLQRVLQHEHAAPGEGAPRLTVVSSPGRFSPLIDATIEFTATQALRQLVPNYCQLSAMHNSPASEHYPALPFREAVLGGLRQSALAWIYLGHGSMTGLDRLVDLPGRPQILCCADLLDDAPAERGPLLAAMLACETGRLDDATECLAERMLLSPGGPLAVIASSRVCMPYGNCVLGIETLSKLFAQPDCVGACLRDGKRQALLADSPLPLRAAVKQIGLGVSPNPLTLDQEVVEHVQMYNLLGDPLLRLP